tara:strand:- start:26 stop:163 length:138 start_codon:yes stop_codon:yes gene_type:complete
VLDEEEHEERHLDVVTKDRNNTEVMVFVHICEMRLNVFQNFEDEE